MIHETYFVSCTGCFILFALINAKYQNTPTCSRSYIVFCRMTLCIILNATQQGQISIFLLTIFLKIFLKTPVIRMIDVDKFNN